MLVLAAGLGGKRNKYRFLATEDHITSETWASVAISLKRILMRFNRRVWTVSVWFRVGAIGEPLCELCSKYSDSIQGEEIP